MGLLRRFVNVARPGRLNRDLDGELEFHRQMRLNKARDKGLDPAEAEREARLSSLGWLTRTTRSKA